MPKATVSRTDEKFDLKSCPGAFVLLRRLSYGEYLHRGEISTSLKMDMGNKNDKSSEIAILQKAVALYEFKTCILDHNLENDEGNPLDFKSPMTLEILDPRIGQEIGKLIDGMNKFEEALEN